jgi:asparagine synthase (glutamine-hydrolysing)
MCGVVGIFRPEGTKVAEDELQSMLDRISYRGPDASGLYTADGIGLGHVRLAIQDLSSLADQPMVSRSKRFVLTYNGEIYNVRELQGELKRKGVMLKSTGDTEALLEYLATFGVAATLSNIEGMFAFALWDRQERSVTLARDRHGIKPLYYTTGPKGELRFASEMKSLISSQPEPDLCTINAILLGLGGTWGEPTVFRGVRHVCAGEWLVFRQDAKVKRHIFFHINQFVDRCLHDELDQLSKDEVVEKVANAMQKSVSLHLVSDAPVGALVSGGVDSSLVTAIAAQDYPNLRLYHANVISDSETLAAKQLAKTIGLELQHVAVTDEDVLDYTAIATYHYEMPMGYHFGSCVPFYMVSNLAAKDGVKVILTGEGSDEYFLGYPIYAIRSYLLRYHQVLGFIQNILHRLPAIGNLLWPRMKADPANHLRNLMFRYELEERRGSSAEALNFIRNKTELDLRIMCLDMVIGNVRTLLHRNDRLAMAWGLESRFPFLGYALARIAVNLPSRYKVCKVLRFGDWRHPFISDKWIIRKIAERYVGQSLSHRAKFGFRSTFYRRLKIDKSYFRGGFMAEYYGLNSRAIDHLFDTGTQDWLAQILLLEVWGQIFPLGRNVDVTREHLRRYITIDT